jgi:hypothetical protein
VEEGFEAVLSRKQRAGGQVPQTAQASAPPRLLD